MLDRLTLSARFSQILPETVISVVGFARNSELEVKSGLKRIFENEHNQHMGEKERPSGQARVSLETDIAEVVEDKAPGEDTRRNSRFVNDCLRAYFISRGWMAETKERDKKESA